MDHRIPRVIGAVFVLAAVACKSDGPSEVDLGLGTMTARIDGTAWSSTVPLASRPTASGHFVGVGGSSNAGTIAFAFQWIEGTATYTIGTGPGNASLTVGSDAWRAPAGGTVANPDGTGGTITITTLNDQRIAGTFEFTLKAAEAGTSPQMRVVTQGQFNIAY